MCPLSLVPQPGSSLNLLFAFAAMSAGLPSSYSITFVPFSQCSTCRPLTTMRPALISPAGFIGLFAGAAITSYNAAVARCGPPFAGGLAGERRAGDQDDEQSEELAAHHTSTLHRCNR